MITREVWTEERGFKSQIENAGKERMGRRGWRRRRGLKLLIQNAGWKKMGRGYGERTLKLQISKRRGGRKIEVAE